MMDPDADPRAQACYDDARKRLRSATAEEVMKDDEFQSCLNRITD